MIYEKGNTVTHLIGTAFALSSIWMAWPAVHRGWEMAFGVLFFVAGMFLMYLSSSLYHWVKPGKVKDILRRCDHISIYVMIACSYTPLCVGVIGGWTGWLMFALQWAAVIGGTIYKIVAFGKYPRLSLAIYLIMGWSAVLIAPQIIQKLTVPMLVLLLTEGIMYSAGTYFFYNDHKTGFHAIWHIFVLLGSIAHWSVVLLLLI